MNLNPILPLFIIYILLAITAGAIIYCALKKKTRKAKYFRRLAVVALILVAMMRPGISNGSAERDLSNLNIFFVVDNTGSMAAKDMNGMSEYRYKVAADDMKRIIKLFPGSKFAIITLDYNVYQAMPLIDDANTALVYVNALSPRESVYSSNSDLSALFELAGERVQKYADRYGDRDSLLFFFSDGENADDSTIKTPDGLKQNLVGGAIIGYGTTNGAHVGAVGYDSEKMTYNISDSNFIIDRATGSEHISKLDERNLQNLADTLGLKYYRRSNSDDKFNNINNFTSENAIYHRSNEKANVDSDFYWIFALAAIALLLWDFYTILESLLLERKVAK